MVTMFLPTFPLLNLLKVPNINVAVKLMTDIASALAYLHGLRQAVLHGDMTRCAAAHLCNLLKFFVFSLFSLSCTLMILLLVWLSMNVMLRDCCTAVLIDFGESIELSERQELLAKPKALDLQSDQLDADDHLTAAALPPGVRLRLLPAKPLLCFLLFCGEVTS